MSDRSSVVAGLIAGGLILVLGLVLVFSKEWAWSLFELLYSALEIEAGRTRMWEMLITTIGLGVTAVGLSIIWSAWKRRPIDR